MSILTTAPISTSLDLQIRVNDRSFNESEVSSAVSQKSGATSSLQTPSTPGKRASPLTPENAIELKYDIQETIIPFPQVEDTSRPILQEDDICTSPLINNIRDEIMATRRRAAAITRKSMTSLPGS